MVTFFSICAWLIVIWLVIRWYGATQEESRKIKEDLIAEKLKAKKENDRRIGLLIEGLEESMFQFAFKNKKIGIEYYDIEEGGEYVKDYKRYEKKRIQHIVEEELRLQSQYFYEWTGYDHSNTNRIYPETIEKIKQRIIKLPDTDGDSYIGFD